MRTPHVQVLVDRHGCFHVAANGPFARFFMSAERIRESRQQVRTQPPGLVCVCGRSVAWLLLTSHLPSNIPPYPFPLLPVLNWYCFGAPPLILLTRCVSYFENDTRTPRTDCSPVCLSVCLPACLPASLALSPAPSPTHPPTDHPSPHNTQHRRRAQPPPLPRPRPRHALGPARHPPPEHLRQGKRRTQTHAQGAGGRVSGNNTQLLSPPRPPPPSTTTQLGSTHPPPSLSLLSPTHPPTRTHQQPTNQTGHDRHRRELRLPGGDPPPLHGRRPPGRLRLLPPGGHRADRVRG